MTIDDFIKAYKELIAEAKTQSQKESAKHYQELIDMLEELKWYREHDLIKRDDVHNVIKDYCRIDDKDCKEKVGCDYCKFLSVQQIPKAEPPTSSKMEQVDKDINVPRNGDCETCNHYIDATMYDCPNDCKYEPYIPKENE